MAIQMHEDFSESPISLAELLTRRFHEIKCSSMLLEDVRAALPVLLGFAPPPSLTSAGSSKLNEVLVPNPFQGPRAIFLLEVDGINDLKQVQENEMSSSAFRSIHILGSDKADIRLPDALLVLYVFLTCACEDDVSLVSLDEPLEDCADKEISEYASMMGGSYAVDTLEPLNGVLKIALRNGVSVNLHM